MDVVNIKNKIKNKVTLPREAKLVAYADDVAIVTVAKHFYEINYAFEITIREAVDG